MSGARSNAINNVISSLAARSVCGRGVQHIYTAGPIKIVGTFVSNPPGRRFSETCSWWDSAVSKKESALLSWRKTSTSAPNVFAVGFAGDETHTGQLKVGSLMCCVRPKKAEFALTLKLQPTFVWGQTACWNLSGGGGGRGAGADFVRHKYDRSIF